MGAPQGSAGHLRPHRMKIRPGRMLGGVLPSMGTARGTAREAWRALVPPTMKILLGRTALKTLDPMALGNYGRTVILL